MGTRSLTKVYEEWEYEGKKTVHPLTCIYRQYDGYPEGLGKELEEFLTGLTVVNGIGAPDKRRIANGAGCLTAQLIEYLKDGQVGNVYIYPVDSTDCGEEYEYRITVRSDGSVELKCIEVGWGDEPNKILFVKTVCDGELL
jgi:hypothetical protein